MFPFLFDVVKLFVAGTGIICVAFYLLKPYFNNKEKLQLLELKRSASTQTLPLRLQAYERMVLLVDRINPSNMLLRLNTSGYSAAELHSLLITEVRNEFQHNITQQIYVSPRAWEVVKRVKNDTLNLVNQAAQAQPEEARGIDLGRAVLGHLSQLENDPYDIALNLIRADMDELL